MYKNKVIICGVDTSKLPLLKESEKTALLKKCAEGDKAVAAFKAVKAAFSSRQTAQIKPFNAAYHTFTVGENEHNAVFAALSACGGRYGNNAPGGFSCPYFNEQVVA